MKNPMMYTVSIRSARSGRKVTSFEIEDAMQARNIAETLMQSSRWASCNAVCLDAQNRILFELQHVSRRTVETTPDEMQVGPTPFAASVFEADLEDPAQTPFARPAIDEVADADYEEVREESGTFRVADVYGEVQS